MMSYNGKATEIADVMERERNRLLRETTILKYYSKAHTLFFLRIYLIRISRLNLAKF